MSDPDPDPRPVSRKPPVIDPGRIDFDRRPAPDDARWPLTEAVRRIIEEITSSSASSVEFEQARDLVEQAAAILDARGHARTYTGAEASLSDHQDAFFLDFSPLVGPLNPLAPPIAMRVAEDGSVIGEASFGTAYEGPPGCVHGGFIAASFDEVLGFTQSLGGQPGMTANLSVDYRSPTPLHRPLRFVGRVEQIDGRKIHTVATLHHGETLCAEARGLFVSMRPEVFERLMKGRQQPAG
jgi:acyl-coenzyme A thioesterase PaaI-like protein